MGNYGCYSHYFISSLFIFQFLQEKAKHKNETPEQRAERLKSEEMIKEWQKRYY